MVLTVPTASFQPKSKAITAPKEELVGKCPITASAIPCGDSVHFIGLFRGGTRTAVHRMRRAVPAATNLAYLRDFSASSHWSIMSCEKLAALKGRRLITAGEARGCARNARPVPQ
jgi:hypothetical protein